MSKKRRRNEIKPEWCDDNINSFDTYSDDSDYKAKWQCKKGHIWEASVSDRMNGMNCPYCTTKLIKGVNDFETRCPDLVALWNQARNGDLKPSDVTAWNNKKVWWICSKGHEWKTAVGNIVKTSGYREPELICPYCNGHYTIKGVNDFATLHPDLAAQWHPTRNGDLKPSDVRSNVNKKVWWICPKGHEWQATIVGRTRGEKERLKRGSSKNPSGCPVCVHMLSPYPLKETFADVFPELCAEWDYDENENGPETYHPYSSKPVHWICSKGHKWTTKISSRTRAVAGKTNKSGRTKCPYCMGMRVIKGENDFATLRPDLINEWDFDKNTIDPSEVSEHSNKKVYWRCKKGHSYRTSINGKSKGYGCPVCAGRVHP